MRRTFLIVAAVLSTLGTEVHAQHHHHSAGDLAAQLNAARAATERYRDFENARRDGYKLFGKEGPLMGEHWYRADIVKQPLDLARPSTLQYARVNGRRELLALRTLLTTNLATRSRQALPATMITGMCMMSTRSHSRSRRIDHF